MRNIADLTDGTPIISVGSKALSNIWVYEHDIIMYLQNKVPNISMFIRYLVSITQAL
jgi:uncharacterized membrane protein YpjA